MHVHILSDTTPYNKIGLLIESMLGWQYTTRNSDCLAFFIVFILRDHPCPYKRSVFVRQDIPVPVLTTLKWESPNNSPMLAKHFLPLKYW